MAWPKLKNIILLILLITNLCLLAMVAHREVWDRGLQRQARADAISFLAQRGVQLTDHTVPQSITLSVQTVERDLSAEQAAAAALLGPGLQVEARGGEVYRYQSKKGALQCHSSGEFWADFAVGAFPTTGQTMQEHALSTLGALHFEGEVLAQTGTTADGSITLRQRWSGVPLLNCQVTLIYRENRLTSITSGRWLMGTPTPTAKALPTVTTALMSFYTGLNELGDVCSSISSITQAYSLSTVLSGPVPLVPVWYVTTDTGAYQLDLTTFTLSRAEASAD